MHLMLLFLLLLLSLLYRASQASAAASQSFNVRSRERVATSVIAAADDFPQGLQRLHLRTCSIDLLSQKTNGTALGAPIALATAPYKPLNNFKGNCSLIFSGSSGYNILTMPLLPLRFFKIRRHHARRRSWHFHAPFTFRRAPSPSHWGILIIIIHIYFRV